MDYYIDELYSLVYDRFTTSKCNKYSIDDSEYDFGNIYKYFSTSHGIAFFSTRREKHYQILNDSVFHALVLIPSNTMEYDFKDTQKALELIINSTVYKNALLHMKKDNSDLPKKITNLYEILVNHNHKVNELFELIDTVINNSFKKPSFSAVAYDNSDYDVNKDEIRKIVLDAWKYVFQNSKQLNDIQNFEKKLDDYITSYLNRTQIQKNELWLKSRQMAKAQNENEIDDIEKAIKMDVLKNESILRKIADIAENKILVNKSVIDIQVYSSYISNDIVNEVYTTNARCCPNVWKSLRESFRLV